MDETKYWEKTVNFINGLDDEHIFSPKELKSNVYISLNNSSSSVGCYINFLRQANYIERISKGKYKRIKKIPGTLTTTKLYNFLYKNPLRDRLNKLKQLKDNMDK